LLRLFSGTSLPRIIPSFSNCACVNLKGPMGCAPVEEEIEIRKKKEQGKKKKKRKPEWTEVGRLAPPVCLRTFCKYAR